MLFRVVLILLCRITLEVGTKGTGVNRVKHEQTKTIKRVVAEFKTLSDKSNMDKVRDAI